MNAVETTQDTLASTGKVLIKGSLSTTELPDSFASIGKVIVRGSLSSSETGTDTLIATGRLLVNGDLQSSESGQDSASVVGKVLVKGSLSSNENSDTLASLGKVLVKGSIGAIELPDSLVVSGKVLVKGSFALVEDSTKDVFQADVSSYPGGPTLVTRSSMIPQNTARNVYLFMRSNVDHDSGISGAIIRIAISKNGGPFTKVNRVVTDVGSGVYSASLLPSDTDQVGELCIIAYSSQSDNTIVTCEVRAQEYVYTSSDIADSIRTELTPELNHLLSLQNGQGLDSTQATMLLEIYRLYGLDPTRPLVVTKTSRSAGSGISQAITTNDNQTTITRV